MRHKSQKGFWGIFIIIPKHKKGYLIYVPSTLEKLSSHDIVFDFFFNNRLVNKYNPYSEAIATLPAVSYIPYAAYFYEKLVIL